MKAIFSKFRRRLSGKPKRRRGFAGIDAAIMIVFILAMMAALAAFGPNILQWFADVLMGGSKGAYSLLIELPILDSSKRPTEGASAAQWVGYAADSLSGMLQSVALGLFSIVLIIAAICYLLETFRIMREGTAMNIIMSSVFTLILIFATKYIYNGVAVAINAFTGWQDVGGTGLIITGGQEIDALVGSMGGGVLGGGWDIAVRFFGSVVIFIIATSILILSVMMGAVRLLLIGCLVAAFPLLLMLRLIPPIKHLAESLIETVIGIMFASVIAAILIHFGYILVAQTSLSGVTKMVIALATFAGAAYMSTMFAGRLGGLFMTMGGMASMASSVATGLTLGGVAMGAGTVAGGAGALVGARGQGLGKWQTLGLVGKGVGAGLLTTTAAALPGAITGRHPGRMLISAAGSMPRVLQHADSLVANRAGTTAENLLYQFGSNKAPGESAHMGLDWYENEIAGKSPKAVGEMFSQKMGLSFDAEKGGREIQKTLASLKENPRMLDRVRLNLENFSALPKGGRVEAFKAANENWFANRKAMESELGRPFYDPALEALDKAPDYYDKILNHHVLSMAGRVAKARTYALMRKGYDAEKLSPARGYEFYRNVVFDKGGKRRLDEEVGTWARDNLGVHVPERQLEKLGHDYKDLLEKPLRDNPRLVSNLGANLEAAGGFAGVRPEADLKALEENTGWVKEHAVVGHGTDFSDFWQVTGGRAESAGQRQVFDIDEGRFRNFWDGLGRSVGATLPSKPSPPSRVSPRMSSPPRGIPVEPTRIIKPKREIFDLSKEEDRQRVVELTHESLKKLREKTEEKK